MPQTLLALAAIFAFAYLALGRHRLDDSVERHQITTQVELAAADLARARMTALQGLAFDEADVGRDGIRTRPSGSALGPDTAEPGPDAYDDVDDFDGYAATVAVPLGSGEVRFREAVAVRYVRDLEPTVAAAGATLTKEVVVTVEELLGDSDRPPARASIRRVVTPAALAVRSAA